MQKGLRIQNQNENTDESTPPANRLVELLEDKNRYLEGFIELNATELHNFSEGYFDNVQQFYQSREEILDIIRCIDELIDEEVESFADQVVPGNFRSLIEDLVRQKDSKAKEILAQDLQVLAAIETEKSKIIRDLQQTSQGKKAIGAYGAGPTAGQTLARQIDEEV